MLREIAELGTADDAALWAQRRLAAKNKLSAGDAQHLEEAFAVKLAELQPKNPDEAKDRFNDQGLVESGATTRIDKAVLALPEPRRIRDITTCDMS